MKVSEENGQIHSGDRLGVSKLYPGYAAKMTRSGQSVGIALADSTSGTDVIVAFVNLGYQQMDIGTSSDGTKITVAKDVDFQGNSLLNVRAIASALGKWSIDENGLLTVAKVKADVGEFGVVQSRVVKSQLGVTFTDRVTGQLYCVFVANGQSSTVPGDCDSINPDTASGNSPPSAAETPPAGANPQMPPPVSLPTTTEPASPTPGASAAVNDPATPVPPTTPVDSATSSAATP